MISRCTSKRALPMMISLVTTPLTKPWGSIKLMRADHARTQRHNMKDLTDEDHAFRNVS